MSKIFSIMGFNVDIGSRESIGMFGDYLQDVHSNTHGYVGQFISNWAIESISTIVPVIKRLNQHSYKIQLEGDWYVEGWVNKEYFRFRLSFVRGPYANPVRARNTMCNFLSKDFRTLYHMIEQSYTWHNRHDLLEMLKEILNGDV